MKKNEKKCCGKCGEFDLDQRPADISQGDGFCNHFLVYKFSGDGMMCYAHKKQKRKKNES